MNRERGALNTTRWRWSSTFASAGLAVVAYGLLWWMTGGLSQPEYQDEIHYWEAVEFFRSRLPPNLTDLRSYSEQSAPLAFILWGVIERLTDGGVRTGRLFVVCCSIGIFAALTLRRKGDDWTGFAAALGLLCCPYFLSLSSYLYTDVVAFFFLVLGLAGWAHGRAGWAVLAFTLAIATRQYTVFIPATLAGIECWGWLVRGERSLGRGIAAGGAAATLLIWFAIWGGMTPPGYSGHWPVPALLTNPVSRDGTALYSLACIGLYFVIPETLLFRRWETLEALKTRRSLFIALALLLLLLSSLPVFPADKVGVFNRGLHFLLPPALHPPIFYCLAWIACVRFARLDLAFWIILASTVLATRTWTWEKYYLQPLVVLWYLRAVGAMDGVPLWRARATHGSVTKEGPSGERHA